MVSGVGPSRGAHEIRCVVTNLGVFHFRGPEQRMAAQALHPGVTRDQVDAATGFAVHWPDDVPTTRPPTTEEAAALDRFDPERALRDTL